MSRCIFLKLNKNIVRFSLCLLEEIYILLHSVLRKASKYRNICLKQLSVPVVFILSIHTHITGNTSLRICALCHHWLNHQTSCHLLSFRIPALSWKPDLVSLRLML